jgi:hypothetical protein
MKTTDFKKGDRVLYIPHHAQENQEHPDCEQGVVSSINDTYVFVKYDNSMCTMITGDEPYTAAATDPNQLRFQ